MGIQTVQSMTPVMKGSLSCASRRRLHINPMMSFMKKLCFTILAILSFFPAAQAAVSSVTPIPNQLTVAATGGAVNVTWRVTHADPSGGTFATASNSYIIRVNGIAVSTISKTLTRTTTIAAGVPETLTFSEVIPVSVTIAKQIAKSGNVATIERLFNDTGGPGTGVARLIVGGASGQLSIRRIDLSFENGGKTSVIGQNSDLRAVAEINFQAKGLLQAEWRVIDSSSIRGGRFERRLAQVRRQLSSSGNGRIRLISPKLPTGSTGLHEIKLVIIDPVPTFNTTARGASNGVSFIEPVLRYYVNPNATAGLGRIKPLEAFAPREGVPFGPDTIFDWHPVSGAAAYQVELFNLPGAKNPLSSLKASQLIVGPLDTDAELVAGKIVPGDQTSATFASFSEQHLTHGYTYLWRVRAIGANGIVVGQSDFRKILYP
ncbi:MAG: hypothetical protein ABJN40_20035 [Sneathiella sp.]